MQRQGLRFLLPYMRPYRNALIIGTVVFAERPDAITLTGAGLIIGSGLYTFARERLRKRALSIAAAAR